MFLRIIGLILLLATLCLSPAFGTRLLVPSEYTTIQAAVDASANHDTVLVAPGTYYENVNYHAHNIVVGSHYMISHSPADIPATIINGSQPQNADTGSCVLMISREDSTTVLEGFTLTGGTGTPLTDQSNGNRYVEGGGIMIENSSPTIKHNIFTANQAVRRPAGITSAGGGGLRAGWSNPLIVGNVFIGNIGLYGGGMVINFGAATIRNNLVCQNSGGQAYGGAGIWINSTSAVTLDNNTVTGNSSQLLGGGMRLWFSTVAAHNNIFWGNRAPTGAQIGLTSSTLNQTYSCVQGGWTGTGNIGTYPLFTDFNLNLTEGSPCINTGNPDPFYNDTDGSQNDMGAYGGPGAVQFPNFVYPSFLFLSGTINFPAVGVGGQSLGTYIIVNIGGATLHVDSARLGPSADPVVDILYAVHGVPPVSQDTMRLLWTPVQEVPLADTLYVYLNDTTAARPVRIVLSGQVSAVDDPHQGTDPHGFRMFQNYPNPFNSNTTISFSLALPSDVKLSVFNTDGKLVHEFDEPRIAAGDHSVDFDGRSLPSGIYFARLEADQIMQTKKMVLLK